MQTVVGLSKRYLMLKWNPIKCNKEANEIQGQSKCIFFGGQQWCVFDLSVERSFVRMPRPCVTSLTEFSADLEFRDLSRVAIGTLLQIGRAHV